jgi:hypothetical protein
MSEGDPKREQDKPAVKAPEVPAAASPDRDHEDGDPELDEDARAALDEDAKAALDEDAKAVLDEAERGGLDKDDLDDATRGHPEGGLDEVDVRELLRSALAPPPGAIAPELLRGVQRRIRARSRGKFYGDGWSTSKSPRSTYLITSIVMLMLIGLVYFVLVPWGGGALR